MKEPLADFYYEKIKSTDNPIPLFVGFIKALFGIDDVTSLYSQIPKLYKIYGVETLFFSLLDCADMENLNTEKMYGIISYFCKKRLEKKFSSNIARDLTKFSQDTLEKASKVRRVKARSLEEYVEENE